MQKVVCIGFFLLSWTALAGEFFDTYLAGKTYRAEEVEELKTPWSRLEFSFATDYAGNDFAYLQRNGLYGSCDVFSFGESSGIFDLLIFCLRGLSFTVNIQSEVASGQFRANVYVIYEQSTTGQTEWEMLMDFTQTSD